MTTLSKLVSILMVTAASALWAMESDAEYKAREANWRLASEKALRAEDGWLSVAGLCWLTEGSTPFALDEEGHVALPSKPEEALGWFLRSGRSVSVKIASAGSVTVNGKAVETAPLNGSDKVMVGAVTLVVIERGQRIGIRVYDKNSRTRKEFTGQKWFPIDPAYRIRAKFVPYAKPRTITITNVLGDTSPAPDPGYVEFKLRGKTCRLEAQGEPNGPLFFNFTDKTTGASTYGAGRFLDTPKAQDGFVVLDFNEAVNPPCAFTDFATCPLPPKGNALMVEVRAGEKAYREHHNK